MTRLKIRQKEAKTRRDETTEGNEKIRILQLRRWDILRHIRNHEIDKVNQALETKRWVRQWLVNMLS